MFLPIGLDDMKVGRVPILSLGIAVLLVVIYLLVLAMGDDGVARLGFIPADGIVQAGWLTALFVHADLWHLLGNLLFLYLAAPCVEDAWGVSRFALLYFVGGLLANVGEMLLDPGSSMPVVGASGAIAACMGALCVQFPRRRVRMFYWVFVHAGTFFVPVWAWGAFWFLRELFDLALEGVGSGVAFGAHLAGFVFGAGLAFVIIKVQGDPFEAKYGPPRPLPPTPPPRVVATPAPALEPLPTITPPRPTTTAAPPAAAVTTPASSPAPGDKKAVRSFPRRPSARPDTDV